MNGASTKAWRGIPSDGAISPSEIIEDAQSSGDGKYLFLALKYGDLLIARLR